MAKLNLGVNVDHVATIRQARLGTVPDPLEAALICEKSGADGITAHLREDRRHIQDSDMEKLAKNVKRLNMEMAVTEEMITIASRIHPVNCCLVPEKRRELTTEGGLDAAHSFEKLRDAVTRLKNAGIAVSVFIDPVREHIVAASEAGADFIELHTGAFANASGETQLKELDRLKKGAVLAHSLGLGVNAGHGIDYKNISLILEVPHLHELNIGHSIIARSVFTGISSAVKEMLDAMKSYNF